MNIEIRYFGGSWPNLCCGEFTLLIDNKIWRFGIVLKSGGSCNWRADDPFCVTSGLWDIYEWPEEFPEEYKPLVLHKVNEDIPWGFCEGCL